LIQLFFLSIDFFSTDPRIRIDQEKLKKKEEIEPKGKHRIRQPRQEKQIQLRHKQSLQSPRLEDPFSLVLFPSVGSGGFDQTEKREEKDEPS